MHYFQSVVTRCFLSENTGTLMWDNQIENLTICFLHFLALQEENSGVCQLMAELVSRELGMWGEEEALNEGRLVKPFW